MLKNISLILSVTAALGIGIVTSADAKGGGHRGHQGGHHGGGHHAAGHYGGGRGHAHVNRGLQVNGHAHENRSANRHFVVGRTYNGHIWFGHGGHRWHGRWYAYGVGPCWIFIDGLWFWNPLACPL
jgi:hypothetical protein